MTWDGTIIGTGTQVITESRPHNHIATVINPGESGEARTWIDLSTDSGMTTVTWRFETDYGYNVFGRIFGLVFAGVNADVQIVDLHDWTLTTNTIPGVSRVTAIAAEFNRVLIGRGSAGVELVLPPGPAAVRLTVGDRVYEQPIVVRDGAELVFELAR